jgi:hypothetical protein
VENSRFSGENVGENLWKTLGSCGKFLAFLKPVENPPLFSTGFPQGEFT